MAQVKLIGEKVRADETQNKTNRADLGAMTVFTDTDGYINPAFINIETLGVDRVLTSAEKTKLAGVATGAEQNVRANWTQATTTEDDYVKNKPTFSNANTITDVGDFSLNIRTANRLISTSITYNQNDSIYWVYLLVNTYNINQAFMLPLSMLAALPSVAANTTRTDANSLKFRVVINNSDVTFSIGRNNNTILIASSNQLFTGSTGQYPELKIKKSN